MTSQASPTLDALVADRFPPAASARRKKRRKSPSSTPPPDENDVDLSFVDVIEGGTLDLCPQALDVSKFIEEID